MIGAKIRRIGFWSLDLLKGRPIRKAYLDVKRIMELPYEDMKQVQDTYVANLIDHAKSTSEYYRNTLKGIEKFEDIPVIDKNVLRTYYEQIKSDKYAGEKLHKMSTSGSTGTPFTIIQDMRKRQRVLAELIYFNETVDNYMGDKFIFFRVWTEANRNSKLQLFMKNMVPVNILHFTDETFENIRQLLKNNKKIKVTLGYVSTYEHLVEYLERCNDKPSDFNLKTIITGSEIQTAETRKRIKNMFGCTVVSRYANEENGVLAHQCKESEEFHVNSANYKIEILKMDSDEPAEYGELGRVVVTDLFNYAFPLIRYDTGDLAVRCEKSECGVGTEIISNIQGRQVDVIYDTQGNALTPHTWSVYMWKYDKLRQYQFIQNDKKSYTMKINDPEKNYADEELITYLKNVLGDDADIEISRVDEIPHLKSGKFKKTICNWRKE